MGQDPDAIRREIEQTRERMGETVEALGYKADVPSRAKEAVSGRVDSVKSKISGATPDGAQVFREGSNLTIVTYAAMVYVANDAADELAKEGVSVEIVDLRGIVCPNGPPCPAYVDGVPLRPRDGNGSGTVLSLSVVSYAVALASLEAFQINPDEM